MERFAEELSIPIGVLPLPCADPADCGQEVIVPEESLPDLVAYLRAGIAPACR